MVRKRLRIEHGLDRHHCHVSEAGQEVETGCFSHWLVLVDTNHDRWRRGYDDDDDVVVIHYYYYYHLPSLHPWNCHRLMMFDKIVWKKIREVLHS